MSNKKPIILVVLAIAGVIFFVLPYMKKKFVGETEISISKSKDVKAINKIPISYFEEFENNELGWRESREDELNLRIRKGQYVVKVTDNEKITTCNRLYINTQKDFAYSTNIRINSSSSDAEYGMIWGGGIDGNSQKFVISDGRYMFSTYVEGIEYIDVDWTPFNEDILNEINEFNEITIHRKGKNIIAYINSVKIGSVSYEPISNYLFCFYFKGPIEAEIEDLVVRQHKYEEKGINLVDNPINGYKKENLGKNVNGKYSDRTPVISADGKTLYFIKEGYEDSKEDIHGHKIYYSHYINNEWSLAKNIGKPLNNSSPNAVVGVSQDGKSLILGGQYNPDGSSKGSGFSISNKTPNGWEVPTNLVIKDYYNDNRYYSACFSADKSILVMSVERDDSYGDLDLYVSFKEGESYSIPMNLGSIVNTKKTDGTPFLAPDNKTLYYSSDGYPGYGDADIFMTRRLDDTWKNWTTPQNLGPEINTPGWDAYFTVPASGDYAYMTSNDDSYGDIDIYRIKLNEAAKPEPVMLVQGRVLDKKTNQPIVAEIIYQDLETNKEIGRSVSDPETGEYKIILQKGKVYGVYADRGGYYAESSMMDLSEINHYKEMDFDIYMTPIELGSLITLNNLFFDIDKSDLKDASINELERILILLSQHSSIHVQIEGHTDNVGSKSHNQELSTNRAKAVVDYLISKGVDSKRLKYKGFGDENPIDDNDTEEGRAKNRRVELRVIKI